MTLLAAFNRLKDLTARYPEVESALGAIVVGALVLGAGVGGFIMAVFMTVAAR